MVGTVNQSSFQSNNWISCQNTMFYAVLETFFNGWEEGFRNSTAEYLFFEYKMCIRDSCYDNGAGSVDAY